MADYSAVLAVNARDPEVLYGRGLAHLAMNNPAQGEPDIAVAKRLAPNIGEAFRAYSLNVNLP